MYKDNSDTVNGRQPSFIRQNLKQSTIVHSFITAAFCLLTTNFILLPSYDGKFKWLVLISLLAFSITLYLYFIMIYPYIAKFHDSLTKTTKNIFKIILDNIFKIFLVAFVTFAPLGLMITYPKSLALVLYFFIFIGFSFLSYINTVILNKVFNKYIANSFY